MKTTLDILEDAEDDLLSRAFLYNHPVSFREGVEASMEAVRVLLSKRGVELAVGPTNRRAGGL